MRVVFDQGVPAPLRRALQTHSVFTAFELGWSALQNGDLLARAEASGDEVPVTTHRNLKCQQNLANRLTATDVLPTTNSPRLKIEQARIAAIVDQIAAGAYVELSIT